MFIAAELQRSGAHTAITYLYNKDINNMDNLIYIKLRFDQIPGRATQVVWFLGSMGAPN